MTDQLNFQDAPYPGRIGWYSFSGGGRAGENKIIEPIALISYKNGRTAALPCLHCVQVELLQKANQVDPGGRWGDCWWYGKTVPDREPIIVSSFWECDGPDAVLDWHRRYFQVKLWKGGN